jgi:high affinity Mn2+ porin
VGGDWNVLGVVMKLPWIGLQVLAPLPSRGRGRSGLSHTVWPAVTAALWLALTSPGSAEEVPASAPGASGAGQRPTLTDPAAAEGQRFAIFGQATFTEQATARFHAPYSGPNSLSGGRGAETFDATLFLGARLWRGAEAWINPEIDQGFGLDNTLGVAGFPSGEAYKVGRSHPYLRVPRLFVRQTLDLGGEPQKIDAAANQLGGSQSADRWVFTVGKFAVTDIFDANPYAHDPRADFLNWAAVDAGSFDYAADAWGFTVGAAAEWYAGPWTLRAGLFDLSNVPNSPTLAPGLHEFQWIAELEKRHELRGLPGKVLVTLFDTRGRMALLDAALGAAPDYGGSIAAALIGVRAYRSRLGVSVNAAQQLTEDLGVFARAGKAAGNVEAYEFSDIDQSVSAGASLKGRQWHRADDTVGLAVIVNKISADRQRYLNAGGLGILVGDGRLPDPGSEQILESYYQFSMLSWAQLTLDYQYVRNPAYNTDRGPVSILAIRAHAQF